MLTFDQSLAPQAAGVIPNVLSRLRVSLKACTCCCMLASAFF